MVEQKIDYTLYEISRELYWPNSALIYSREYWSNLDRGSQVRFLQIIGKLIEQ
jgi:hypothetical protein